ncbi:MAG: YggS family pyridoxal phosphate-dependent enzyme [Deltaproteobacteria bacterium]|nr:YggS family pyridoxal phosphate-dependent enzyme [Deltaproteobacteria bacterium]
MSIADNLARVRAALPAEVTLVAVSKTRPATDIREAMAAGQLDFGENYAQELRDKAAEVEGPRWHFIGSLQRNKVKYVVGRAALVHDVDSIELAEEIGKRSAVPTGILVGVNFGEAQKSGVPAREALDFARRVVGVPGVALRGLMCIPPPSDDPEASAPYFAELASIAAAGRDAGLPLHDLSMGMSHDWPVAVRHGANIVRVGSAIFGARPPKIN